MVAYSLTPTDQCVRNIPAFCTDIESWHSRFTADNQNKPNMTNLAIKGIIGIQAMSEISQVSGMRDDAQRYAVCLTNEF